MNGKRFAVSENTSAYLFLLPALCGLLLLTIIPIFGVLAISFTKWSGLIAPEFIGVDNYIKIFTKDLFFKKSVVVTIYYAFGAVTCGMLYSFLMALMLNQNIKFRGVFRAVFYLPYIVPAMAVYIVWSWLFDANFGLLNYLLTSLGMDKSLWLFGPATSVPSLIIVAVWCSGNYIVIFLAGLQNVPAVYHEAAKIDGASSLQRFRHITLPLMTPIIFYNFIMSMIACMQVFVPSLSVTNGGPANSTLFMVYLIYREGIMRNNMGYASAISFIFFIMIGILTALIFRFSKGWLFYEGK